jgi:hypothetical protein
MDLSKIASSEIKSSALPEGVNVASGNFTKEDMSDGYVLEDQAPEIPDLDYITQSCIKIIRFVSTDEMVLLKSVNEESYKLKADDEFKEFADKYYSLFHRIICEDFDVSDLKYMIKMMKNIKNNNLDIKTEHESFVSTMAEKYVYPEHGGKDGFLNFVDEEKKKTERKNKKKARKQAKKIFG